MTKTLHYGLILLSDLHVGTGMPGRGSDDLCARRADGTPIIPATVIKGAVRDLAKHRVGASEAALRAVFGSASEGGESFGGSIWFSDAVASDGWMIDRRTSVTLTEHRTAAPGRLFDVEVVSPWTSDGQRTVLWGRVEPLPGLAWGEGLRLVAEAIARLDALGGRTSRGLGRVAPVFPEVTHTLLDSEAGR